MRFATRRFCLLASMLITVGLGICSRKIPSLFPAFFGKYPGDALWAQVVYYSVALVLPSASVVRISLLALLIAHIVEFSQLYHSPMIDHIRKTTVGHLLFGSSFSWYDLLAYAVGIALVAGADTALFSRVSDQNQIPGESKDANSIQ